jgi:penicillin-binding protein 1C
MEEGLILPTTLLPDVPTVMSGYRPENFMRKYEGKVPANQALSRSLNVPAVHLLQLYGVERFRKKLIDLGLSTIVYSAEHYGLPLILGGAEVKLWDLAGVYSSMGRTLQNAYTYDHQYHTDDLHPPLYLLEEQAVASDLNLKEHAPSWDYGALWSTLDAMRVVNRPREDGSWEIFQSARKIHWKTGTSYGFKDAWAVGVTPDYTVAIWVGNADGEGRPGLVGVHTAAPVMLDIFRLLPNNGVFEIPFDAMKKVAICRLSGHPANSACEVIDTLLIPDVPSTVIACPYHKSILVDASGRWQVHKNCAGTDKFYSVNQFVLDPSSAYYYQQFHPEYSVLLPMHPKCAELSNFDSKSLEVVYPPEGADIYLPIDLNKEVNELICQATPRRTSEILYWYLDASFIGKTKDFHTMKIDPIFGKHQLTVVHSNGDRVERNFRILSQD